MQAKLFLLINGLIVAALVFRLIMVRKRANPTPLDIYSTQKAPVPPSRAPQATSEKTLNCYFQFNGMMFDSFEVLGVPAGSSKEACHRAYIDLRGRSHNQSPEVIEKAWEALQDYF